MNSWQWLILAANLVLVARNVNTQTIIAGPRDTAGVLGTAKRLECTVTDASYSTVVLWEVPGGSVLINHQAPIPSEYVDRFSTETETVNADRNEYTYSLIIHDLQDDDGGVYQCKVLYNSNIVAEDSANVHVMSPNNDGAPTCFANPSGELITGESVTLTCISSSSTADLVWRSGGSHLPTTSSTKYAPSTSEFSFTVSDDGKKYSCVSIELYSECSLTLSVQYPPRVEISLTAAKDVELGESVGFSCDALGNPSSFTYSWYYAGTLVTEHDRINGFQIEENGQILTLPEVSLDDDGVTLTCVVSNGIGDAAGEYYIVTVEGSSAIEIIGPILVCVVVFFILFILIVFTTWYCRQKNTIKTIKKKELVRRAESVARRKRQNGSMLPVKDLNRIGGSTNGGYLSDLVPYGGKNDEDEDRLRPIPRRKSESSSIGKKGSESSMSDYIVQDMPTEEDDEDHVEASYVYQVNPNFGDVSRKKGSYTVNRDDFEIPSLHSEVDSEDIDSIIPSTDL